MTNRKNKSALVSAAAAILGSISGKMRTPKQIAARKKNAERMNLKQTVESRISSAAKVPDEVKEKRAKTAVSARWKKYQKESLVKRPIDNERFRSLSAGIPAREIAEGMGISIAAVNSWRRLKNPVPISAENGKKFLTWFKERKHADLHID